MKNKLSNVKTQKEVQDFLSLNKVKTKKEIQDFLSLPLKLYSKENLVQNRNEELSLIEGNHPLSKYFSFSAYNLYEGKKIVARISVTEYKEDSVLYFGHFELYNNKEYAIFLFKHLKDYAKKMRFKKIVGPINGMFFIGYRLKLNDFAKKPYIGEPYNLSYYPGLIEKAGFTLQTKWFSHYFEPPTSEFNNKKACNRLAYFMNKGYEFVSPTYKTFDTCLQDIYYLLIDLYSIFPTFKYIEKEDFIKNCAFYKYILDFSLVKIVYYDKKPVAFSITAPDYHNNLYGKFTFKTLFNILKNKKSATGYVALYFGASSEHLGLGYALAGILSDECKNRHSYSIGALIQENKVTAGYFKDEIANKYEYGLYELIL